MTISMISSLWPVFHLPAIPQDERSVGIAPHKNDILEDIGVSSRGYAFQKAACYQLASVFDSGFGEHLRCRLNGGLQIKKNAVRRRVGAQNACEQGSWSPAHINDAV